MTFAGLRAEPQSPEDSEKSDTAKQAAVKVQTYGARSKDLLRKARDGGAREEVRKKGLVVALDERAAVLGAECACADAADEAVSDPGARQDTRGRIARASAVSATSRPRPRSLRSDVLGLVRVPR